MELRELRYFVRIAKERSYTKAAKGLFVSQPALSKMMRKLEHELDAQLFRNSPEGVQLTDYGTALYSKANKLIAEFDSLPDLMQEVRGITKGHLRIGVTPIVNELYLVELLAEFNDRYPGVEIKLMEGGTRTIFQQLLESEIDLGFAITGLSNEQIDEISLFKDKMVVCANTSNPLSKKDKLAFAELKDESFNFYSATSLLTTQILNRCTRAGFRPKVRISSSKVGVLMQMTAKNKGICILPRPYAEKNLLPELKLIDLADDFPWEGCLLKRHAAYETCAAKAFERFVLEGFQRYADTFQ